MIELYGQVVESFGTQTSNLNNDQITEGRCFLSQIYGCYCGAGADYGKGCQKTVIELELIWKADLIKKGKKICECSFVALGKLHREKFNKCPDCKGIIRQQPFLVVNEKIGNGLHLIINDILEKYANINYFCKSCNMIFDRKRGDINSNERNTAQFRKSHQVRPKFKNEMRDYLAKFNEICYKGMINKWSGRDDYNCSQEVLEDAFDQELQVSVDMFNISEFGMECNYKKCSGEHVKLINYPIEKIVSAYLAFKLSNDNS